MCLGVMILNLPNLLAFLFTKVFIRSWPSFLIPVSLRSAKSRSGLAFSSVTGSHEESGPMSLREESVSGSARSDEVCLSSKDCPLEVLASAASRSARCQPHVPGLSAVVLVTVGKSGERCQVEWREITHRAEHTQRFS